MVATAAKRFFFSPTPSTQIKTSRTEKEGGEGEGEGGGKIRWTLPQKGKLDEGRKKSGDKLLSGHHSVFLCLPFGN